MLDDEVVFLGNPTDEEVDALLEGLNLNDSDR
jgi:hypothetical protein